MPCALRFSGCEVFLCLFLSPGIFPREPRHKKRANKGSSAPTSFYYAKDIAYLQHEPILKKLREHKAFAKKLSRALGRGEWSSAKSLEANKPTYRLDHIIKERYAPHQLFVFLVHCRFTSHPGSWHSSSHTQPVLRYPTFIDALRDIDDALCLISLFASLPSNDRVPSSLIQNCTKLANEWQLYVMNTHSLRKVFLSIKGVYYQAEVQGEKITWLVPYQFTLNVSWPRVLHSGILIPPQIPSDVDIRVMLTFLELYQTLLSFVFFKLYMDEGWVYPPSMDLPKDEGGAGVGAFSLQNVKKSQSTSDGKASNESQVSNKAVKQMIKELAASISTPGALSTDPTANVEMEDEDEDFVSHPSKADSNADTTTLPTLKSITESASSSSTALKLFAPYSFYLSRETPRSLMEFVIRAFGGQVGWPSSSGSGSPYGEDDGSITHVIIDRPVIPGQPIPLINEPAPEERERRRRQKCVQPQWVMDCINAGRILPEERYARGAELPPHLSPFGEEKGAYEPNMDYEVPVATEDVDMGGEETEEESGTENEGGRDEGMDQDDEDDEDEEDGEEKQTKQAENAKVRALQKAKNVAKTLDSAAVRAAELEAEAAGVDFAEFDKATKVKPSRTVKVDDTKQEGEMNKVMMSNKQRKLYEKMKHGERKRNEEVSSAPFLPSPPRIEYNQPLSFLESAVAAEKSSYRQGEEEGGVEESQGG